MLNFALCDDNLSVLNRLSNMLESIFINHNIDAKISLKAQTAYDVINFVEHNKVDVLILDINLKSETSGCDIANIVRQKNKDIYIIFTTGHLEYAIVAYKLKTFDYLPKPITYERLEDTVVRLFEDINGQPKRYIKIDKKNTLLDENEINYIKRDGMKLVFHTDSKDYETYTSLNKIQENLPSNFIRCHKSYVANVNKIINVEPVSNTIFFANKSTCYIGPKYKNYLMEVMKNNGNVK